MAAPDFCIPPPQFGEWSEHTPTSVEKIGEWHPDEITERRTRLLQHLPIVETKETVPQRFRRLADEWSRETMHISSASDLINDKRYQEIIGLGWDVVPYLLTDLQQNKRFWFPALAAITGVRPFDLSDTNNPRRMTEAWVRWGKRKGLIADQPSPSRADIR
jgi:hypothetical protein